MATIRHQRPADQLDLGVPEADPSDRRPIAPEAVQPPAIQEIRALRDIRTPRTLLNRLRGLDWAFTDATTSYYSHGLHPYPAKFIPQLPRQLIANLTTRGELVWDPFGGSGTTALEAILLGRRAFSTDLNPVAKIIGEGKVAALGLTSDQELRRLLDRLTAIIRNPDNIGDALRRHDSEVRSHTPSIPHCDKWFHEQAIRELAYVRWEVGRLHDPAAKALALATFSKIIARASFQDGETRYASKPRTVPAGEIIGLYARELTAGRAKAAVIAPILACGQVAFATVDLREQTPLPAASVDAVVTSPPYPNATDYHLYHRFRLYWLGFSPQEIARREIGSHLRHQKERSGIEDYLKEMRSALARVLEVLRPGRYAALVIGDALFEGKTFRTSALLSEVAQSLGFDVVGTVDRPLHETKRSFISAARRLRSEQILVIRRPACGLAFRIAPPSYKLWPHEQVLRSKEVSRLVRSRLRKATATPINLTLEWWQVDHLRRLTFSHAFEADNYFNERTWQAVLENGDDTTSRKRKDPKYATHGLHAYKGKFYPQLAKALFGLGQLERGATVLDPYCGSGTVLLEAALNGLHGHGIDLNPMAVKIARAKTSVIGLDPITVDRELTRLINDVQSSRPATEFERSFAPDILTELRAWFPVAVLRKLVPILSLLADTPEVALRELAEVCLSDIVRDISHQDPKDLRIRRRKEALSDAPVVELFVERLSTQRKRLAHFAEQRGRAPQAFGRAVVAYADSRDLSGLRSVGVRARSVDAVVTSPPYATALPYIDTDRLSLLLLLGMTRTQRAHAEMGLTGSREITTKSRRQIEALVEACDFEGIPSRTAREVISRVHKGNRHANVGFRRKNQASLLYRYYRDIAATLKNLDEIVKPGGSLFFVIGDSITLAGGEEIVIRTAQALRETGASYGWRVVESIPITVTQDARPHYRNSITENDIIWFEKPEL